MDRKELLHASLSIYRRHVDENGLFPVEPEAASAHAVDAARALLSLVDEACAEPGVVCWSRVSRGVMGGVDTEPFGTFSVTVRDDETLPRVLLEYVPEVKALVDAVECYRQMRIQSFEHGDTESLKSECAARDSVFLAAEPFREAGDA